MMENKIEWGVFCRPEVFEQCRSREGFADLVCLARCINTLTFLYSSVCDLRIELCKFNVQGTHL
jgi:hypothetical protein